LDHYGIGTPLVSYHEHNEAARAAELVLRVQGGENVALVSDAGTPLISDPGYRIVHAAVEAGLTVVPIPGACAAIAALAASGMATDSFLFGGFLPRKSAERRRRLERGLDDTQLVLVFYESPHRIVECLQDIEEVLHDPPVVAARELTKIHEEFIRGKASEIRQLLEGRQRVLGEFTIVIGRRELSSAPASDPADEVRALLAAGHDRMEAIKSVARRLGIPKRDLYKQLETR
jgi:16S rRNA (cytidine1402-2'-O)-methyltransferase